MYGRILRINAALHNPCSLYSAFTNKSKINKSDWLCQSRIVYCSARICKICGKFLLSICITTWTVNMIAQFSKPVGK